MTSGPGWRHRRVHRVGKGKGEVCVREHGSNREELRESMGAYPRRFEGRAWHARVTLTSLASGVNSHDLSLLVLLQQQ